jgi:hypothetical protein
MLEVQRVVKGTSASISIISTEDKANIVRAQIDSHDNRLTITHIQRNAAPNILEDAIKRLCEQLKKLGGKQIIIIANDSAQQHNVNTKIQKYFEAQGFSTDTKANATTERLRTTVVDDIIKAKELMFTEQPKDNLRLTTDKNEIKLYSEQILALMKKSGFSPQKIEDYTSKGIAGISLMYQDEHCTPMALINSKNELVGIFRFTALGNDTFYISDTFVNADLEEFPKVEGLHPKASGTAYLYNQAFVYLLEQHKINKSSTILLIAPPDRVEEFDTQYRCRPPNTDTSSTSIILAKFSPAEKTLNAIFTEQIRLPHLPTPPNSNFSCHYPFGS